MRLKLLLAGFAISGAAGAGQYSVPGLGAMELEVPDEWRLQQQPGAISLYLRMGPGTGDAFSVQVSSNWLNKEQREKVTREFVRQRVETMKKDLLAQAVESDVPLVELKGKDGTGYYFSLTDRTAAPAGAPAFKHLTQGMLATSVGMSTFTVRQQDAAAPERQQALDMLARATYSRQSAGDGGPQGDDALRVIERQRGYELWVPSSRIYMDLPRTRQMARGPRTGGATDHPRYFYFRDRLFNVSGWFEPAPKFKGMQEFWASETRAWQQSGLPPPIDPVFRKIGEWDAVFYDQSTPLGINSHLRAHWLQAGTWIDIHVSLTGTQPSEKMREVLESYLKGVLVHDRTQ